jgi:iron complex outermembrane receptor protein
MLAVVLALLELTGPPAARTVSRRSTVDSRQSSVTSRQSSVVGRQAQQPLALMTVEVVAEGRPIANATVIAGSRTATTDRQGRVTIGVEPGEIDLRIESSRHLPASRRVTATLDQPVRILLELEPLPELAEEVVVTATRTETRLQDQPLRVEVIDREEIEEKALMTPGSVAMLLAETTGLRVQTTGPTLGAANVRIQARRGRYSQLVADGLPLYGAQGDSFSLLQVPPLDLGQVEVIKGSASALYGASALGGVINLVSRRPRADEQEALVNVTSQSGRDVTMWIARAPVGNWAWSLLGGYHGQTRRDLDSDGWSDVPSFNRGTVRPRVFFDDRRGHTFFGTVGVMAEDRSGGTMDGRTAPDGRPFPEALESRRVDGGFVGRWLGAGGRLIAARGSVMRQSQDRRFGAVDEHGVRVISFGEVSLQGVRGRHTWVAGAAFQQDRFAHTELPQFDYRFSSPALFAQNEVSFGPQWSLALSARADVHSEYGTLAAPRLSLLWRPEPGWTLRLSRGSGAFAPTPFIEEAEETGLSRLLPLAGLRAERARSVSLDVTRTLGRLEVTGTVFASRIDDPVEAQVVGAARVALVNVSEPTRTVGTELLLRYRAGELLAFVTHGWTRSTELDPDAGVRRDVPLTPDHAASFNIIWEAESRGRLGVEGYYVGRQALEDNPYRATGRRHLLLGSLAERRWGRARLFVNVENWLDVRQTRDDPLVRPARLPDGRWTVDAWAPLDGRVINGGIRVEF